MVQLSRNQIAKKAKYLLRKKAYLAKHKSENSDDELSDDDEQSYSEEMVGRLFNSQFVVIKYLGRGGFAKVWLVYDIHDSNYYAMKVFPLSDKDEATIETKNLRQIGGKCPQVIKLYHAFETKDSICLILELLGYSLHNYLNQFYEEEDNVRKFPSDQLIKHIVRQSLIGLDMIHQKGLVHTDIKAENIMLDLLTDEIRETITWFNSLNLHQVMEDKIKANLPEDYASRDKNKRKVIKKKIKTRVLKLILLDLEQKIKSRLKESEELEGSEKLPTEISLSDIEPENTNVPAEEIEEPVEEGNSRELPELEEINYQELEEKPETQNQQYHDNLDFKCKIMDFNSASSDDKEYDDEIQCRSYRPPETVIGDAFHCPADIWSFGCVLFEILTDTVLFDIDANLRGIEKDRAHLKQMFEYLGKMPQEMSLEGEKTYELFDQRGRILKNKHIDYTSLEVKIKEYRPDLSDEDVNNWGSFLRKMLTYEPRKRFKTRDLLNDPFLNS